jgi:hypothetical protein
MSSLHVLVGSADRSVGNLVESLTRSAFRNEMVVKGRHVRTLEDLVHEGESGKFGLILCNGENLIESNLRPDHTATLYQVLRGLCTIKTAHQLPIMAFGISDPNDAALIEAGADCVFGLPLNCTLFQSEIQRLVTVPMYSDTSFHPKDPEPHKDLARAWHKLIHTFGFSRPAAP